MLQLPQTLTADVTLSVPAAEGAELAGELRYDPSDAFAVSLALGVDCAEPVVWTFGRDLLVEGVTTATGAGDVALEPVEADQQLRITLATDATVTVALPLAAVVEFLVATFTLVPTGAEMDGVDLDAELAALLG